MLAIELIRTVDILAVMRFSLRECQIETYLDVLSPVQELILYETLKNTREIYKL